MRAISVLVIGAALASCTTAPPAPSRSADRQAEFQQLIGGKVAQAPIACLPHYQANDMRVIDENTVVFRASGNRVYVAHLNGGCNGLGSPSTTLVTKQYGTADLCDGQIATVYDSLSRTTVGSCSFERFQPFVRPGA